MSPSIIVGGTILGVVVIFFLGMFLMFKIDKRLRRDIEDE